MIINSYIPNDCRIMFYCDLSHENFVTFIKELHKMGFETQVTDSGEFEMHSQNEKSDIECLWADEDTWLGALENAKKIKKK